MSGELALGGITVNKKIDQTGTPLRQRTCSSDITSKIRAELTRGADPSKTTSETMYDYSTFDASRGQAYGTSSTYRDSSGKELATVSEEWHGSTFLFDGKGKPVYTESESRDEAIFHPTALDRDGNPTKNYFRNNETMDRARTLTKSTPEYDLVKADIEDTGVRYEDDLRSRDHLAKWLQQPGAKIADSELGKLFREVNVEAYKGKESIDKGFKGSITLPSIEKDSDGTEFAVINGKTFTIDGKPYTPKQSQE